MNFFRVHKRGAIAGLAMAVVLMTGGVAYAYWTSSGSGTGSATDGTASALTITQDGTTVYNSTESPLPGSLVSEPFQATQTSEFGNEINLSDVSTPLSTVEVTMEDWACQNWAAMAASSTTPCTTTPGSSFSWPITLTLYNDAGNGTVGSPIATDTQTFNIPYRPSYNSTCGAIDYAGGEWLDNSATAAQFNVSADNGCHHGLANNIQFNFSSQGVTLPSTVIYGISFNTQTYGTAPTGVNGPYNSLNVGLTTTDTQPTVGTDTFPGTTDLDTTTAQWYCDDGAAGTGSFRLDSPNQDPSACAAGSQGGWSVNGGGAPYYIPAVEFNNSTASDLYPGGPPEPINFSVTNPGTTNAALNTVTISISSITNQHPTVDSPTCLPGWFTIVQPNAINGSLTPGQTYDDTPSGASIELSNPNSDQDACQGATINLSFISN